MKRSFKLSFDFGVLIPELREQIEDLFDETNFFVDWDYRPGNDFAAIIKVDQSFNSLDFSCEKFSLHLYGEKRERRIKNLRGDLIFHKSATTDTQESSIKTFERLLQRKIKNATEKSRPTIELLTPKEESTIMGKQELKARIEGMHLKNFQVFLDNDLLAESSSEEVAYTLDTTEYQDGVKELTMLATDEEDREISYSTQIKISNTPPKLLIKGIRDEGFVKGDKKIGLVSKGGNISEIEITIDGELRESKQLETPRTEVRKAYHWDTRKFKDGWHDITFTVKTQTGKMTSETKHVLSINPTKSEKPKRRLIQKGKFYKEILETIKILISPHFGGIVSVNEATRIMNRIFDFDEGIKNREVIKAVNSFKNEEIRWISPSHLIEFVGQRKITDNWLKEKIFGFARSKSKNGTVEGFNTDEVVSHIKDEQKSNEKNMKRRFLKERIKRTLDDLEDEGRILRQEYPPKWFIPSSTSIKRNKKPLKSNEREKDGRERREKE